MILSYILWHPEQTINSIKEEVKRIDSIGRYRIPQFFRNSSLRIVPGTPIFSKFSNMLSEEYPGFLFKNEDVYQLFKHINQWFLSNVKARLIKNNESNNKSYYKLIGELKIQEKHELERILALN